MKSISHARFRMNFSYQLETVEISRVCDQDK